MPPMRNPSISCLLIGLLAAWPARSETLHLRSGESREARILAFSEGRFQLEGGESLSRDAVASLDLQSAAPTAASTASAPEPPPDQPRGAALREPEVEVWNRQVAELEARYPGFATTLVRDESIQELLPDGSRKIRTRLVYRINKDAAIGYGTWQVGFDPARERVEVVRARTLLADGTVLPLDRSGIKIQDARSSASNLTNRKVMVWQLEGVRVGSYVEHVYDEVTFNPFREDFFFPRFYFQGSVPVVKTQFTVITPEDVELHWVGSDLDKGPVVHLEGVSEGRRISTWQANRVAPMVPEPNMPGSSGLLPRVSCSLFPDWETFFDWEGANLKRNVEPDPSIVAKAREIVGDETDPEKQVAAIYRFLQEEIRYVSVKSGIGSGWSGHPAPETLANGYGDCVDKAVLFSSLLRTLGIESQPITILTNDVRKMETRLPGLDANHCISQIHLPGKSFFLDSTTTNYRYPFFRSDDHGQPATNPILGKIVEVPLPRAEENLARQDLEIRIGSDGSIQVADRWSGNGSREAQQRGFWKRQKKQDYAKIFRDFYSGVAPGARLEEVEVGDAADLETAFGYRTRFRAEDYGVRAGPLMIVKIPFFTLSHREVSLKERKYPIDYRTTRENRTRWVIHLPEGFRVKAAPEPVEKQTRAGRFSLEVTQEEGRLVMERVFRVENPRVPVEEYQTYRSELGELEALGREQLFLEVE